MNALSASDQIRVWESGRRQTTVGRALAMLSASSGMPVGELALISPGQRDARLLELQERMFGPRIEALAECPGCGESLELEFDTSQVRMQGAQSAQGAAEAIPAGNAFALRCEGYDIRFRLPDSSDLQAIAGCENAAAARNLILERCILEMHRLELSGAGGEEKTRLPEAVEKKLVEEMAKADPQANIRLSLACPACRNEWSAIFDIASFIWSEISARVKHLLREVHWLASAYGWSETDILKMSAERRSIYLEMLGRA